MPRTKSHRLLEEKRTMAKKEPQKAQKPEETKVLDDATTQELPDTINPFGVAPENAVMLDEDAIAEKLLAKLQESGVLNQGDSLLLKAEEPSKDESESKPSRIKAYVLLGGFVFVLWFSRGILKAVNEVNAIATTDQVEQVEQIQQPVQPPALESDIAQSIRLMARLNVQAVKARAELLYHKFNNESNDPKIALLLYIEKLKADFLIFAQENPQVGGSAEQNNQFTEITRELEAAYTALEWLESGFPQEPKTVDLSQYRQN